MKQFDVLDANESIFFAKELEFKKARSSDILYPDKKFAMGQIVPISREASPAAETITFDVFDSAGIAKIISNYADDLPAADVSGVEVTSKIKSLGSSYSYNIQEIRAAQMANKSLQTRRSDAADRAIAQEQEKIGFEGDADTGLLGFHNHPNIQSITLANDGTGSSTTFASKTPDQVLRDLNLMATQISNVTKGVESPDTLLLPIEVWNDLTTRARSTGTDTTILQFFLNNSPHINQVDWVNQFSGAGAGSTDIAMMYKKDPDKLTLEIPLDKEHLPPQERNLAFTVPVHGRIGGVIVYYPLSIIKAEGV